jgi:hypothetical protein
MRLARMVFKCAAVWGVVILVPLYFLFVGGPEPADVPFNHAQAYFGFLGVTIGWQLAFWIIGSAPARLRPLMPAAVIEKLAYVVSIIVLFARGLVTPMQAASGIPDFVLAVLFVAAYVKTPAD